MQRATRVASHRLPLCSQWDRLRALKTRRDKPPHYQDNDRANDCADETSVFARLIPPDCLAKICCYKSSNNPEHGRHDVPSGLKLISRINQFRDHPGHKPNYDGPKEYSLRPLLCIHFPRALIQASASSVTSNPLANDSASNMKSVGWLTATVTQAPETGPSDTA